MKLQARKLAHNVISTLQPAALIFMTWKALVLASGSPSPIAVVSSESMEPGFQVGDVIFLWNRQSQVQVGDIAALWFPTRDLPMVHRVVQTHFVPSPENGTVDEYTQYILTKGDNNENNDAVLYPNDEGFASREHVIGLVRGTVPYLGWPFIKLNELLSRPTRYML